MVYLESKRFIHRDLAARNILLASKFQAKISDFGLSRIVSQDKDYYKASVGGRWPVKWYAPESINFGTFTHKSDVWSYGVLLWEMYTYGKQPYEEFNGAETLRFIETGKRLPTPTGHKEYPMIQSCYDMMNKCWKLSPAERPSFQDLFNFFSLNPEYSNIRELLLIQDLEQLGL